MSVFDPKWKYVHSTATDIRKTIAKARRDLAKKQRTEVRAPNLKLMPSSGIGPDSAPAVPHHDKRFTAPDDVAQRSSVDRLRLAPVQRGRRIPSW
jgi:hypothetical protein